MAHLGRDLGGVGLILAALTVATAAGPVADSEQAPAADSARSLLLQFQNEDLAVIRHLNGGDVEAADRISNRLQRRLERALEDPDLSDYHDRIRSLQERVARFDDQYLDPRTGDGDDLKLWPEHTPVDWVTGFIESWRSSWESGDIDNYLSYYSDRFRSDRRSGSLDLAAWGRRKRLLARSRTNLRIELDDLRVYRQDGRVIAYFRQNYRSPQFEAVGFKSLVLVREPEGWRILREYVGRRPPGTRPIMTVELPRPPAATVGLPPEAALEASPEPAAPRVLGAPPPPDPETEIGETVTAWKEAWEGMDPSAYLSYYSADNFRSRGGDRAAWGRRKRAIWATAGFVKVKLEDLTIRVDNGRAVVRCVQTYRSRSYRDRGLKTLELVRGEGGWRIVSESWVRR